MPILAAVLLSTHLREQTGTEPPWRGFAVDVARASIACLPFFLAHLLAQRLPLWKACVAWLAGFGLYPIVMAKSPAGLAGSAFAITPELWAITASFSGVALLLGQEARRRHGRENLVAILRRVPITLDGAVIGLLTAWTFAFTSLFASTPDGRAGGSLGL